MCARAIGGKFVSGYNRNTLKKEFFKLNKVRSLKEKLFEVRQK